MIVSKPGAKVSVTHVAKRAGVSIATVSRVLNNSRRVNPEIAEQVRKAMAELRYSPRFVRRKSKLLGTEKKTVAIVSLGAPYREWFEMPVMAAVVAELSRAAQQDGMGVLMAEIPDAERLSPLLRQKQVDGALVFVQSNVEAEIAATMARQLPVVRVMGAHLAPVEMDHVGTDNNAVGYVAARYLLGRGCSSLAYLTTQPEWDLVKLRWQGFAAAAQRARLATSAYIVDGEPALARFYGPDAHARPGLAELIDEVARHRPAGLFVSRDEEVVQVYRLLAERKIEPGKDLAIISCDNENVRLSMLRPRPASIELGTAEIARRAVHRLAARMRNPDEAPIRVLVNPHLVLPPAEEIAETLMQGRFV